MTGPALPLEMSAASGGLIGLMVALGSGLLIGLERERRKGRGTTREAAGLRTFSLSALAGGLAQWLQQPLLVAAGAVAVLVLAGVAYWHSRKASSDPGLTTELALFVTYLVGVLSVQSPALGAGAAVVIAVLLAGRERLHRFATHALTEAELHDALLLAALLLVLLPLLPQAPPPWLGGLQPRTLLLLLVLILMLQGAGHVALRVAGSRIGLALAGLASGFVSSTATVASMGARARGGDTSLRDCAAGAVFSTAATWVQLLVLLSAVSPNLMRLLLPAACVGTAAALASGALMLAGSATAQRAPRPSAAAHGPLRVREALIIAALLTGVSLAVGQAQRFFGDNGVIVSAAAAAMADAHAAIAAVGALHAAASVDNTLAMQAVVLAVTTNSLTRSLTAWLTGGTRFGALVSTSLLLSTALAAATVLF